MKEPARVTTKIVLELGVKRKGGGKEGEILPTPRRGRAARDALIITKVINTAMSKEIDND